MSRRVFMGAGASVVLGFRGLQRLAWGAPSQGSGPNRPDLVPDPAGVLDLPPGFRYRVISRTGDPMDDGFVVPGNHDGMAAFAGPAGRTLLVRNHELTARNTDIGPFGADGALLGRLDPALVYDMGCMGGTTTLVFDTREQRLEEHFLSLTGTLRNCAGGPTPWNSWVSSEEAVDRAGPGRQRDHGYNFEVPAAAGGPVSPVALREMGRFNHEAIAVDPASGVVYETEDRPDSLLYRFIPNRPGELARGGRLQALRLLDIAAADTTNRGEVRIGVGMPLEVDWVDLDDVEAPRDDLRLQGASKGAATFARGEGIWFAPGRIYFAATSGGENRAGQIWMYRPSPAEGTPGESADRGSLTLFLEPNDVDVLENADNLTVAPWGDIIICEDGPDDNWVRGATPEGQLYSLARNAMNDSEFAGATFSPDQTTLFVNIQRPGMTLAITGPWGQWWAGPAA